MVQQDSNQFSTLSFQPASSPETKTRAPVCAADMFELDSLGSLSSMDKLLLHHFVTETSMIASHPYLREWACHKIFPMMSQIPSLMYATMALSALHRSALLNDTPGQFIPEALVVDLLSLSLRHLRQELQDNDPTFRQPLLHTIRTLCVCEIYSGKADSSWRVHVDGARVILKSIQCSDQRHQEPSDWLITKWYSSIEALSALTSRCSSGTQTKEGQLTQETLFSMVEENCLLDLYAGYSSDLNLAFREIGILIKQLQQTKGDNDRSLPVAESRLESQARCLEKMVQDMIRRDYEEGLKIPAEVPLDLNEIRRFEACNTAYQHTALIYIYRRTLKMNASSTEVQTCVKKILDAVYAILPVIPMSPWALLTTPIFTAG